MTNFNSVQNNSVQNRFIVGIDLGTTTCVLSYIDLFSDDKSPKILPIPQLETKDLVTEKDHLPSFCYLLTKQDVKQDVKKNLSKSLFDDSTKDYVVGAFAAQESLLNPQQTIHSAKSWLSTSHVQRHGKILPWASDTVIGTARKSPIEVSSYYLSHLKDAWNNSLGKNSPEYRLEEQKIVITVPASFDEVATQLTLEAACEAGLKKENIRLLEEPQASFYHWFYSISPSLDKQVLEAFFDLQKNNKKYLLVCDLGGGTCDFSLLEISLDESASLVIKRMKVSDHILLGGDNINLAIARLVEQKFCRRSVAAETGQAILGETSCAVFPQTPFLASEVFAKLVAQSKIYKEKLFDTSSRELSDESFYFAILGKNLFETQSIELKAKDIQDLILEGFFPLVSLLDKPKAKESGIKEWNLPYATDSAVTRHLAAFLQDIPKIDYVLFAGGSFHSTVFQKRVLDNLRSWFSNNIITLENKFQSLSIAYGASLYAYSLEHNKFEVESSYPKSVYVKIKDKEKTTYLCVVPKGFKKNSTLSIETLNLKALTNKPVLFQLYSSNTVHKKLGELIEEPLELTPMPLLATNLLAPRGFKEISVGLQVHLTENQILQLSCISKEKNLDQTWDLTFNLQETNLERASTPEIKTLLSEASLIHKASELLTRAFDLKNQEIKPSHLFIELEKILGPKDSWDLPVLRSLGDMLLDLRFKRHLSEKHEQFFFSLLGYLLRPGYGDTLDLFRCDKIWSELFSHHLKFKTPQNENQWFIFLRRICGGFSNEQQDRIFNKYFPALRNAVNAETLLLMGSLERMSCDLKIRLTQFLISGLNSNFIPQRLWAIGRLLNRNLLYAGPEFIVRPQFVENWISELLELGFSKTHKSLFIRLLSNASRLIEDRELDLSPETRRKVLDCLKSLHCDSSFIQMVETYQPISKEHKNELFGENLPTGLLLG